MRCSTFRLASRVPRIHWSRKRYSACLSVPIFVAFALTVPAYGATSQAPTGSTQSGSEIAHVPPTEKSFPKAIRAPAKTKEKTASIKKSGKALRTRRDHSRPTQVLRHKSLVRQNPVEARNSSDRSTTKTTKQRSRNRATDRLLLARAQEAYWRDEIPQAIADYETLIRRHPLAKYYGELGNIYFQMGNRQAAAHNYVLAAKALIASGKPLEAGALLPTIQALDPAAAQALLATQTHSGKGIRR